MHFASYPTCWRRLNEWMEGGAFEEAWRRVLHKLDARGRIDWRTAMADATFASANKGGSDVGPTKPGKGSKLMLLIDGKGLTLAVNVHSASPAEVTLIEPLLDRHVLVEHSIRLIYDRAADSDPLRERLAADGIELICPHRKSRKRPPVQDGRSLKCYRS